MSQTLKQPNLRAVISSITLTLAFVLHLGPSNVAYAQCEGEPVNLLFTFWGSPGEKAALENMVSSFNESHPCISVRAQHIPTGYEEKMTTMVASGTQPDLGYLNESQALAWADEGLLLDLTDYFQNDPEASRRLPQLYFRYDRGKKTLGTNSAAESTILFYNKTIFDQAGLDYPTSKTEDAWTQDEFVEVAKKLTKDRNGNDAMSPDFDPNAIQSYGFSFSPWWPMYLPFIYSDGGEYASEDGTQLLLNQPKAVEALQKLADLIYVHHVSPSPTQSAAFPSAEIMMQTNKVAMTMDGHWKVLDFSQARGLSWSMGVLPKFQEPKAVLLGSPTVIFANTEHPEEAFEFYKFHNNPEYVDLFKKGLWMPLQESYYTDPEKISSWLDGEEGVYPPEARDVLTGFVSENAVQPPIYWLKNTQRIFSDAVDPALDQLWTGKVSAQEAADHAVAKAAPLMQGRW